MERTKWKELSSFGRVSRVSGLLFLGYLPLVLALALWPVPGKYPWLVPIAVLATTAIAIWRNNICKDDVGAGLVIIVAVGVLATWTLFEIGLDSTVTALLVVAVFGFPLVVLVMATIASGAADNPYLKDPYDDEEK